MVTPKAFYDTLAAEGIRFYTGVPDSLLKSLCAYLTDHGGDNYHIIAANEGNAVGLAAGHHLATGETPVVYMQNSGIGNAVNPLLSLADEAVYSIPMLLVIGWRGEPGVHDEPQHVKQGAVTLELLNTMGIPCIVLSDDEEKAVGQLRRIAEDCRVESRPHASVVRKGIFDKYSLANPVNPHAPLSREEALKIVVDSLPEGSVTVSTTGKLSRELFEYRRDTGAGHDHDFLTVGSMGHASSIALGIALRKKDRKVVCLDGDGALLMHTGALTTVGGSKADNFIHFIFNNGAHESVGAQPTRGLGIDIPSIAIASGYRQAVTASSESEIRDAVRMASENEGPTLIELRVAIDSRENLGRPTTTPIDNKKALMQTLGVKDNMK